GRGREAGGRRPRAGLSAVRTSSSRRGRRRGGRRRSCASRDELRESLRPPKDGEVGFESRLDSVLIVCRDGLSQAQESLLHVTLKRQAAGREVVRAAIAVTAARVPAEQLERLLDVAAVLLEHGGVVQLLRFGRRGALRPLSGAAGAEIHARAVEEFLLVGVLFDEVLEAPRGLVEMPLVEELDGPLVLLARRRGLLHGLLERSRRLSWPVGLGPGELHLPDLLFQVLERQPELLGKRLQVHPAEVRFQPAGVVVGPLPEDHLEGPPGPGGVRSKRRILFTSLPRVKEASKRGPGRCAQASRAQTLEEAGLRETLEECGATADLGDLLGAFSYPGSPVVVVVYRGPLAVGSREPHAGDETLGGG